MHRIILAITLAAAFTAPHATAQAMSDCHSTKDPKVAHPACEKVIGNESLDARTRAIAHGVRGKLFHRAKNYDEAIAVLTKGIEVDPSYAILFSSRGMSYYAKNELELAKSDYDEAIRLDPKDFEPLANRAILRFTLSDFAGAAADFSEAIRLSPKLAVLYSYRGKSWLNAGEADKAAADFRKVIELDPANEEAHAMLRDLGMEPK